MFISVSTSLNPDSKSAILAEVIHEILTSSGFPSALIDVRTYSLPLCDGNDAYQHPEVRRLTNAMQNASAVFITAPIYNYDVAATTKNFIELTGQSLAHKVVGLACAAGGGLSYMAPLSFLNSVALDFQSITVPRYVYAQSSSFDESGLIDPAIHQRLRELVQTVTVMAQSLPAADGAAEAETN